VLLRLLTIKQTWGMQLRYVDCWLEYFSRSETSLGVRLCVSVHWREVAHWLLFVDAMSATITGSFPASFDRWADEAMDN